MRKCGTKVVCLALTLAITFVMSNTVRAAEFEEVRLNGIEFSGAIQDTASTEKMLEMQRQFEKMTVKELNDYIDSTIANLNGQNISANAGGVARSDADVEGTSTSLQLKLLWLAAARAARLYGYPCSAKLVECSVYGVNYTETKGAGGLFRDKIVSTNTYKNYIKGVKNGKYKIGKGYSLEHRKNENADLYYSLHKCTYTTTKSGKNYKVTVNDLYDFEMMEDDSGFTGVVNNWAWLCQHKNVLHKIKVNISFKL